ncbi:hypothetical protein PQX77_010046 [Marasmius sp. AFHP31]|nr:hypothetical protein PQX77_010046 [Marasmius sp. AFHP31]
MPKLIQSLARNAALEEAQAAASSYYTSPPVSARMHENQGMFSRTVIVTLADNTEIIVQLKDNEIDLSKVVLARSLLGPVVPDIHAAKSTEAYFAYVAPLIPGQIWSDCDLSMNEDVSIVTQVARLLRKCSLGIDSSGTVDHYILPRLQKILEKEIFPNDDIRARIEKLCGLTDQLKKLPLTLCHIDVNARNIVVKKDQDVEIVGLLDWEQASLMPFGMSAWCIRFLSVPIRRMKDYPTERTQPMAEAFWKELAMDLSIESQRALIIAMQVGYVLISVYFEGSDPSPDTLSTFTERFDWFEGLFGPFCDLKNLVK